MVLKPNGFLNMDGSLKSAKDRAKFSKLKSHSNAGSKGRCISRRGKKVLRLQGAKGDRFSGLRTRLGVLKPKKRMDAIKKAKSSAGGASGACKARRCKKCDKGSRATVHVEGRCRFMG